VEEEKMRKWFVFAFALMLALGIANLVRAEDPLLVEYPVPASPLQVAVESPGRIWFTQPNQNAIGRLVVTSTLDYGVTSFPVPTASSQPYAIDFADGKVWFTEKDGNKIGRLDPTTGTVDEFVIPTPNSQPTGLDALGGTPTVVWFAEKGTNKLGRLTVASPPVFDEYPLPGALINPQPESVALDSNGKVWFTAPGAARIGRLDPSRWPGTDAYYTVGTGSGSEPWSLRVDNQGYPWFTDRTNNRVGKYFPTTLSTIAWSVLPNPNSFPNEVAVGAGFAWISERDGARAGQVQTTNGAIRESGLGSSSSPAGLAVDSNGCVWIAESGLNKIASWCSPYFHFVRLPLVIRSQ
jgi:sugar lactone lactonase YvrE